jgi:hypothetical protein
MNHKETMEEMKAAGAGIERQLAAGERDLDDLARRTAEIESRVHKARWRGGPEGYGIYWVCGGVRKGPNPYTAKTMSYQWGKVTCPACLLSKNPQ